MPRVAWLTDIHLNFLDEEEVARALETFRESRADLFLLGGDVAEAPNVVAWLERLDRELAAPIYFVLGNHDFYRGSIRGVRDAVTELAAARPGLTYLTAADAPQILAPGVALVGHDGWADARSGDYERSLVMMNDYQLIAELAGHSKRDRWPLLKALGDEAADHVRRQLIAALATCDRVWLLTHVPPLRAACWYNGETSNDEWAPHFICQAMGQAIVEVMGDHTGAELTVLCGHTHSPGECHPLPNVRIFTGGAEYGRPEVARTFDVA